MTEPIICHYLWRLYVFRMGALFFSTWIVHFSQHEDWFFFTIKCEYWTSLFHRRTLPAAYGICDKRECFGLVFSFSYDLSENDMTFWEKKEKWHNSIFFIQKAKTNYVWYNTHAIDYTAKHSNNFITSNTIYFANCSVFSEKELLV